MINSNGLKVAIVHEYLNQYGGAERVLEAIHELYPAAPVYTLMHDPDSMPESYKNWDIRESGYLKNKLIRNHYKKFFFLYPIFMEQFDLKEYDLVISSSYAYAHGIVTSPKTCHICYCHTPMRFVWVQPDEYRARVSFTMRWVYDWLIRKLQKWDQFASMRPDYYIAASQNVAERISQYYRQKATVIHPPVDFSQFQVSDAQEDYYLLVSRLVLPYKRVDLAMDAFNKLGFPLKIVGDGSDRQSLQRRANSNIQFLGHKSGVELTGLYAKCKALIFPSEDDFGIVPLEANACGRPVIAYKAGGILESQVENITAVYFESQTIGALVDAVKKFETMSFNPQKIRESASRFDKEIFKKKMMAFINDSLASYPAQYQFQVTHS